MEEDFIFGFPQEFVIDGRNYKIKKWHLDVGLEYSKGVPIIVVKRMWGVVEEVKK